MKFDEVLRRFSAFFEAEGIRYALAGGNAMLAWGHQRLTNDVDFAMLRPEHLIAMKVHAMKQQPMRVLIDAPDVAYLMALPGVDRARIREYFSQQGLLKIYDELEKERR
ncbi:MAG TPA: hypothetical protein VF432_24025 [Thermoanaerobaculia bacterium]